MTRRESALLKAARAALRDLWGSGVADPKILRALFDAIARYGDVE